jgi:hypothetical protein
MHILDVGCLRQQQMAQGLGEGPDEVLAGTKDGHICLLESADQPHQVGWTLGDRPYGDGAGVNCMAATDQVVVAGYSNGDMRVIRMDTPTPSSLG